VITPDKVKRQTPSVRLHVIWRGVWFLLDQTAMEAKATIQREGRGRLLHQENVSIGRITNSVFPNLKAK